MSTENTKTSTIELLKNYYKIIDVEQLPSQSVKSKWKETNKFGFLLGVIYFGEESSVKLLYNTLSSGEFVQKEDEIIDLMHVEYIKPFKQHIGSRCQTPTSSSSLSRADSADNVNDLEAPLKHKDLKRAVVKRDGVCLFCWNRNQCEAAHIIAQKNDIIISFDESSLFQRAGLTQKHQVQNGLLLCSNCHKEFDALKKYVDIIGDKLVLKIVNSTNDTQNIEWKRDVGAVKVLRKYFEEDWAGIDNRVATDLNDEMCLFFVNNDSLLQPNKSALNFHKTACLIWRMAGGAESEDEYCPSEDENDPIEESIEKVRNWSTETLYINNII